MRIWAVFGVFFLLLLFVAYQILHGVQTRCEENLSTSTANARRAICLRQLTFLYILGLFEGWRYSRPIDNRGFERLRWPLFFYSFGLWLFTCVAIAYWPVVLPFQTQTATTVENAKFSSPFVFNAPLRWFRSDFVTPVGFIELVYHLLEFIHSFIHSFIQENIYVHGI